MLMLVHHASSAHIAVLARPRLASQTLQSGKGAHGRPVSARRTADPFELRKLVKGTKLELRALCPLLLQWRCQRRPERFRAALPEQPPAIPSDAGPLILRRT